MPKSAQGFTLIELLIVIVVIGILSSIGFYSYDKVQAKARDAQRKNDIGIIMKSLELYHQDKGKYPPSEWVSSRSGGTWIPGLDVNYIKEIPVDPKNTVAAGTYASDNPNNYVYSYWAGAGWCGATAGDAYILVARLENTQDSQGGNTVQVVTSGGTCGWSMPGIYAVTNP